MPGHRLLTAEREEQILRHLRSERVATVARLAESLDVSATTVRRDLRDLDERGLLQRVRGGAALPGIAGGEPIFSDKESLRTEAKLRIAESALSLIHDGDAIYLDGGSTVLHLARLLDRRSDLTVVTNSLMAASALMSSPHRLILVGGEFRALSRTLVGPLTASIIRGLNVDRAFMGTIGITVSDGMTTTDPAEAYTKEQILARAAEVILLADKTKLGVVSFVRSGSIDDIDMIITDEMKPALRAEFDEHGIEVVIPGTEEEIE